MAVDLTEFGQRDGNGIGRVLSQVGIGTRQHHHRSNRHWFVGRHGNTAEFVRARQGILRSWTLGECRTADNQKGPKSQEGKPKTDSKQSHGIPWQCLMD